ncbi:ALQxL family class IV lanthipeptide [Microbispora sp. KK1-11]|nr:ALQxL family class IV lanthipeptide [Microbispora sp. KK1-11]
MELDVNALQMLQEAQPEVGLRWCEPWSGDRLGIWGDWILIAPS